MKIDVKFSEQTTSFNPDFGEVHNISDGGYERGYAAGYEQGRVDFDKQKQEKTITIIENGTVEIVPDDGYLLSKAVASVEIASDMDVLLERGITSINSEITAMRDYACYCMTTLKTVNLPNIKKIGTQTFRACTQLYEVNAPKVTQVDSYAFYTCSRLSKVDFPALTTIGASCFAISAALKTLILRSETVVTLGNVNAFTSTPIATGTGYIYVPDNLVAQYKGATNWSTYANQIKGISELEG